MPEVAGCCLALRCMVSNMTLTILRKLLFRRSRSLSEVAIACRMPEVAGCYLALHRMVPNMTLTRVRHFLHWPSCTLSWTRSHADICWYPQRLVRSEWALLSLDSQRPVADLMTPTTSASVLSLHQQAPGRACGIFPIGLCRSAMCAGPDPSSDQYLPWWGSAKNKGSSEAAS
jgi:hypothetical protein